MAQEDTADAAPTSETAEPGVVFVAAATDR